MTKVRACDVNQALRLARRSRSQRIRVVANMQTSYWRDRWHEGLSPRAAYRRHRQCWE
jgi:hypothetical protein